MLRMITPMFIYILYNLYIINNMMNHGTIAELLFPTRCVACGRYSGRLICAGCTAAFPLIRDPVCRRCGKPAMYYVDECNLCRGRLKDIEAGVALAVYEEPLRTVIHGMKYGRMWRLARPLGYMAAVRIAPVLGETSPCVTYVPMHPRRRRVRGYDHAELLARAVAEALGLPLLRLLERTRHTLSQTTLDLRGRRENVRGAFRATTGRTPCGEVVLVDDVMTTGCTLSECAGVLRRAGVKRVFACVVARDLVNPEMGEKGSALFSG